MNGRITLRLPENCTVCGAAGTVVLEQTIKGTSVMLNWSCRSCGSEWGVLPSDEQPERRHNLVDRRANALDRPGGRRRTDRRKDDQR